MTPSTPPIQDIPELSDAQRIDPVPDRLAVALEAKAMESKLLDQMVAQWMEKLRPEVEKMAQALVRRSAEEYLRGQSPVPRGESTTGQELERP